MNEPLNPYAPPRAEIEPVAEAAVAGALRSEPRSMPARYGARWIGEGWQIVRFRPGLWIVMMMVLFAIFIALSFIPLVNFLVNAALPLFVGGWMIACHRVDTGDDLRFEDLFAGFTDHFGPLAIVGLIYIGATFVLMLAAMLVVLPIIFLSIAAGEEIAVLGLLLFVLLFVAITLPIVMAIWFAPALVVLNGVAPVEAMKLSFKGCLRNILPFLVYGLVALGLLIAGMIPLLLGLLLVLPLLYCSVYSAYLDIFIEE